MADGTSIEYVDSTWVIVTGCDHTSPGCDLCYAARLTGGRLKHRPEYAGLAEGGRFNGTVRVLPERLDQPLHWRKPRRIFVSDMADLFHADVPDSFIADTWSVMAHCPHHTFLILTKRHARLRALLSRPSFRDNLAHLGTPWPLPNVHIGVSVESQQWAENRIPALLETPAAVRWISAEPLLGPVDLSRYVAASLPVTDPYADAPDGAVVDGMERVADTWSRRIGLDWVVTGGESGPGARPWNPWWLRNIRSQCERNLVPWFHKQHGAHAPATTGPQAGDVWVLEDGDVRPYADGDPYRWDYYGQIAGQHGVLMRPTSKKAAGRLVDGIRHNELPRAAR